MMMIIITKPNRRNIIETFVCLCVCVCVLILDIKKIVLFVYFFAFVSFRFLSTTNHILHTIQFIFSFNDTQLAIGMGHQTNTNQPSEPSEPNQPEHTLSTQWRPIHHHSLEILQKWNDNFEKTKKNNNNKKWLSNVAHTHCVFSFPECSLFFLFCKYRKMISIFHI